MIEVRKTAVFTAWLANLRDQNAKGRIVSRISRLEQGNSGDVKSVGGGISEMRIDYGPGYRVYFVSQGSTVVILLCGGDKRTQDTDIRKARALLQEL
jgi:putative addiction module killer protein